MTDRVVYRDIDLTFVPNPRTGDVFVKTNEQAIKNSIRNLIMTNHYERPFRSELGSNVSAMLFENATPGTVSVVRQQIINLIRNFEPRVDELEVEVTFSHDLHTMFITIVFTITLSTREVVMQLNLERTR